VTRLTVGTARDRLRTVRCLVFIHFRDDVQQPCRRFAFAADGHADQVAADHGGMNYTLYVLGRVRAILSLGVQSNWLSAGATVSAHPRKQGRVSPNFERRIRFSPAFCWRGRRRLCCLRHERKCILPASGLAPKGQALSLHVVRLVPDFLGQRRSPRPRGAFGEGFCQLVRHEGGHSDNEGEKKQFR
jgi:hypothetical protein